MAHDMKNPLAAIRGAADVLAEGLRRGDPPEGIMELAEGIRTDADRLAKLVEDYRRFVKVEPILTRARLSPIALSSARAASLWAHAGASIRGEAASGEPCAMMDVALVEQVVDGLVRNAVEALDGRAGEVVVAATSMPRGSAEGVAIVVDDDGPGMDAHTRARATEDFFTTKATGSGLGLSFAARVADAHGGELRLAARPGGGTRATLWLPAARADGTNMGRAPADRASPLFQAL